MILKSLLLCCIGYVFQVCKTGNFSTVKYFGDESSWPFRQKNVTFVTSFRQFVLTKHTSRTSDDMRFVSTSSGHKKWFVSTSSGHKKWFVSTSSCHKKWFVTSSDLRQTFVICHSPRQQFTWPLHRDPNRVITTSSHRHLAMQPQHCPQPPPPPFWTVGSLSF
jgi:hypothetical protein